MERESRFSAAGKVLAEHSLCQYPAAEGPVGDDDGAGQTS